MLVARSGRGKPRPYVDTKHVGHLRRERACPFRRTNERSVTWRSGLFIRVPFTNTNPPIPGPGPQARCGKGVWSPEDQGDRCRVPRSFGPSGAGGEQRASLRRTQYDDQTRGKRRCGGYTSSVGCADTFPSRGRQKGITPTKQNTASSAAPRHRAPPAPPDRGDHTKS